MTSSTNSTTDTFLQIEAIFHEAFDAPVEEQEALITARSGGNLNIANEVRSLLRASQTVEHLTLNHLRESGAVSAPNALPDRRRIGPYELDRLLGRGGMGAVYLAHRADGQFDQQVAIKLIDLPLATDFFRERFRQERQILAGLQHPYIARLLDGGVSDDGDLYLAMEYIDGVPINRYAEKKQLTIEQRLRLFLKVCEAVQFAHQNLVVHRDLKPDNIFVAEDGTPRLLDFGTAKLTSPSLDPQEGDLTRQGFQSYTPQYASPEQVLGNSITTASDTYSLGVLLFRLLTNALPYEIKELNTSELIRIVCEDPPRKPSDVMPKGQHLDPDLEAILAKSLRKEPTERYRTAEQFASDLWDYIDGKPVAARKGSFRYRASKFARRNRLALTAAAVVFVILFAGIAGVLWQARIALQQRHKAEARSEDLRQLSKSLLSELDDAIQQLPGSTGVQKLLVTRVLEHLDRMAAETGSDAEGDRLTKLDLVDAYTSLASLQGDPYFQNLGDPQGALVSVGKALALAEPLDPNTPPDKPLSTEDKHTLESLAHAQVTRSEILFGTGQTIDAIASMQAAVQSYDRLIANPNAPVTLLGEVAAVYGALGDEQGQTGTASLDNREAALTSYRKTIDIDHRALKLDPSFLRAKRGLAIMQMKIGSAEMENDPAQALKDFEQAVQLAEALPEKEKATLTTTRLIIMIKRKEANALEEVGRYADAIALFEDLRKTYQKLSDQDPQDIRALADLQVLTNDEAGTYEDLSGQHLTLANQTPAQLRQNQLTAMQLYAKTAEIFERIIKLDPTNENNRTGLAFAQVKAGDIGQELHQPGDWAAMSQKGFASLKEIVAKPHASSLSLDYATNAALEVEPPALRDPEFAAACAERRAALSNRKGVSALLSIAEANNAAGHPDKAQAAAREALALLPPQQPNQPKSRMRKLLEIQLHPQK